MTESGQDSDRHIPKDSWLDALRNTFRYGFSIIRRDGLRYLIKRLVQLASWELRAAFQSIYLKIVARSKLNEITVEDVQVTPQQEPVSLQPDFGLPNPEQSDVSSTTPGDHNNFVQQGISSHNQYITERQRLIHQGCEYYLKKRVLFISPIRVLGGGANLIILAVRAMRRMGVDAQIMNLHVHRAWFERNYSDLDVPVFFADIEDVPRLAENFDAILATSNPTVSWITATSEKDRSLAKGYFIQDYEPYFYPPHTHEYKRANASYTILPNLVRLVTTPWISSQIELHHHANSHIVGAYMDTDLFRPRPRKQPYLPNRSLRIAAMIRPTTARRNPKMTMAIFQQASRLYGSKLEFILFGCDLSDPGFASLDRDFPWQLAGNLRPTQVASLLNEADIFVDYSDFQAFGLIALEAMATGLAVIVPAKGGTDVYANQAENCLVVDTQDQQACFEALQRLIEDETLRMKLQTNAISTAARFYPELPAFNMLKVLFSDYK